MSERKGQPAARSEKDRVRQGAYTLFWGFPKTQLASLARHNDLHDVVALSA
jgi:hypothetical protein